MDFCLIFVPFGHYDEPEILRYPITSICPISADGEEVRSWLLERIERGLDPNTTNVSHGALRFLYRDTLRRPEMVDGLRYRKRPRKLPGQWRRRRSSA